MVSGLYGQNVDRFRDLALGDIAHMTQLYGTEEPTGTSMFIAHAMGVGTGPCAFLTILPTTPGNNSVTFGDTLCAPIHPTCKGWHGCH
jgi:hypothetical protein